MTRINPEILEKFRNLELGEFGVLFLLAVKFELIDSVSTLIEYNLFPEPLEREIRINYMDQTSDGEWKLRDEVQLFVPESDLFQNFSGRLASMGFTSSGHPANQITKYSPISFDPATKVAFQNLQIQIGADMDLERLLEAVNSYYASTESPKGLARYLAEHAALDYRSERNYNQRTVK